ncbi:MAG: metallophosphoesterase, partial [Gemmatimonadales bacterium]
MKRMVHFFLVGFVAACRPEPPVPAAITAPAADSAPEVRFLAVGRQGYGNEAASRIAAAMERVAAEKPTHGVLYLGDNFYPRGVTSTTDRQWRTKFESLYDGTHLRGMPFFAILGNHDHEGTPAAELEYAAKQVGSGRWRMDAPYYVRDFGRAGDRVLVRIVFLDAIPMLEQAETQLTFAREAFAATGNPIWRVVASHYAARSLTLDAYTRDRTLTRWLPEITAL